MEFGARKTLKDLDFKKMVSLGVFKVNIDQYSKALVLKSLKSDVETLTKN
jgi:hypothetical protein